MAFGSKPPVIITFARVRIFSFFSAISFLQLNQHQVFIPVFILHASGEVNAKHTMSSRVVLVCSYLRISTLTTPFECPMQAETLKDVAHYSGSIFFYCAGVANYILEWYNIGVTPAKRREERVEAFRRADLDYQVNINLFDEGFDCPDVEYIQMARPTLSLAKYLQMVGRGLRINHENRKKVCMIIDNVGNYRKFGLPDQERNWPAMFVGLRVSTEDIILKPMYSSSRISWATMSPFRIWTSIGGYSPGRVRW